MGSKELNLVRKSFVFLTVLVLLLQLFVSVPVSAADAMQATAKAGDPVIDGVARPSEYGTPFVLTGSNSVPWNGWTDLDKSVEYCFAWSEKGLYMAVTYDASIEDMSLLQLNCNPGKQLYGSQQGLFFTVYPDQRVLLHNHKTDVGDASFEPYDLSNHVQIASRTRKGRKTTEVLLPIEAFRITQHTFAFTEGSTMEASAFVMLYYDAGYHSGGAISGCLENWTLDEVGLGTLVMENANGTSYESSKIPAFMPKLLVICALIAGGVMVLGFAGILTVVIVFVVGRLRKRR